MAVCQSHDGTRFQADLDRYVRDQPARPMQMRPVHPYTIALLLALAAAAFLYWSRPVRLELTPHSLRIGSRRFSRFEIQGCELGWWLGRPILVVYTQEGRWRSPPLYRSPVQLQRICRQIQSIASDELEAQEEEEAKHVADAKLHQVRRWHEREPS